MLYHSKSKKNFFFVRPRDVPAQEQSVHTAKSGPPPLVVTKGFIIILGIISVGPP